MKKTPRKKSQQTLLFEKAKSRNPEMTNKQVETYIEDLRGIARFILVGIPKRTASENTIKARFNLPDGVMVIKDVDCV